MHNLTHLNIYTDGSASEKSSSWGFLANLPKPVMKLGLLPSFVSSPSAAEAMSIVKALEYLINTDTQNLKTVKIYTDCQSFTSVIHGKIRSSHDLCPITVALKKQIKYLAKALRFEKKIYVKISFVRAHTLLETSEKVICNRIVDLSVRKLMRKNRLEVIAAEERRKLWDKVKVVIYKNFLQREEVNYWIAHGGWNYLPEEQVPLQTIRLMKTEAYNDVQHNLKNIKKQQRKAAKKAATAVRAA